MILLLHTYHTPLHFVHKCIWSRNVLDNSLPLLDQCVCCIKNSFDTNTKLLGYQCLMNHNFFTTYYGLNFPSSVDSQVHKNSSNSSPHGIVQWIKNMLPKPTFLPIHAPWIPSRSIATFLYLFPFNWCLFSKNLSMGTDLLHHFFPLMLHHTFRMCFNRNWNMYNQWNLFKYFK
jgi:hypothetical protein